MAIRLRDSDIRHSLPDWLCQQHSGAGRTALIHELKMPRPSARIDLAMVNGVMAGYEIKSDVDSLARLPKQVAAYGRVFDRVTLVTTNRHLKQARSKIPPWWGLVVSRQSKGIIKFDPRRKGRKNPQLDDEALLHILHRKELLSLLKQHSLSRGARSKRKAELVTILLENLTSDEVRDGARVKLRARPNSQTKTI